MLVGEGGLGAATVREMSGPLPDRHGATPVELRERVLAERRGEPFLLYRDGERRQVIFPVGQQRRHLTIGRGDGNDVALRWDPEVSRLHAALECVGDEWVIVDDGLSHNGTFVNGDRVVSRRRLREADVIIVGRTTITWCAPASAASRTRTAHDVGMAVELTPAQRRVLVELCRPMAGGRYEAPASNRRIAEALYLSVDTVKGTLRQLFEAFGLDGLSQNEKRAALANEALARGLVHRSEL